MNILELNIGGSNFGEDFVKAEEILYRYVNKSLVLSCKRKQYRHKFLVKISNKKRLDELVEGIVGDIAKNPSLEWFSVELYPLQDKINRLKKTLKDKEREYRFLTGEETKYIVL